MPNTYKSIINEMRDVFKKLYVIKIGPRNRKPE